MRGGKGQGGNGGKCARGQGEMVEEGGVRQGEIGREEKLIHSNR